MLAFGSLWWIVILAALAVWLTSSIVWMVLPHHRGDFAKLPDEDAVMGALGAQAATPGQYMFPHCGSMSEAKEAAFAEKQAQGPVGVLLLRKPGAPNMGKTLALWFCYTLLASFVVAYVGRHSLAVGADFLSVMRLTGAVAMATYALQPIPDAIWMGRPWPVAAKSIVDGLAYGLVTGAVFGAFWPAA